MMNGWQLAAPLALWHCPSVGLTTADRYAAICRTTQLKIDHREPNCCFPGSSSPWLEVLLGDGQLAKHYLAEVRYVDHVTKGATRVVASRTIDKGTFDRLRTPKSGDKPIVTFAQLDRKPVAFQSASVLALDPCNNG